MKLLLIFVLMFLTYASSKKIDLRCEFGTPRCDPRFRACYYCNVFDMVVREKNVEVGSLKSKSEIDSISGTQILTLENQVVHYMPSRFADFVPNTQVLKIISSGLKEISFSDLQNFHHMKELYVTGNDLESLPSNLLQIDANIQIVDFSGNKIKNVGSNFFDLKNVLSAKFLNNVCINAGSQNFGENGVEKLEQELFSKCQPTQPMLINQINWLRSERSILRQKLAKCDVRRFSKTTTNRPCQRREDVDFRGQVDLTTICRD